MVLNCPSNLRPSFDSLFSSFILHSNKRKPGPLFSGVNKKTCLPEQRANSENVEGILQLSSEKSKNDRSSQADENEDTLERDVSTQSPGSSPQSGPLLPDERDQVANLQRLAALEKEVLKLRRLLGLRVHRTTQDTMTTEEKPKDAVANLSVGCQTDVAEVSVQGHISRDRYFAF